MMRKSKSKEKDNKTAFDKSRYTLSDENQGGRQTNNPSYSRLCQIEDKIKMFGGL